MSSQLFSFPNFFGGTQSSPTSSAGNVNFKGSSKRFPNSADSESPPATLNKKSNCSIMQSLASFISTPEIHVKGDACNQLTDSSIPLLSSISKMKDSDGHQLTDLPLSIRSDNNARVATLIPS